MTNAEIIQAVRNEIDKLYGEYKDKFHQNGDQYHLGLIDGLDMAERVLDTLESEKPIPADLEEAAEKYAYMGVPDEMKSYVKSIGDEVIKNFIAGAEWQKEQFQELLWMLMRPEMSCKWYYNGGDCKKGLPGTPCSIVGCVAWEKNPDIK